MSTTIANYEEPRKSFDALLQRECDRRILLVRGGSGSGKTTLINYCCEQLSKEPLVKVVPIELRGTIVSIAEIFSRVGFHLSWDCLPRFTDRVAALLEGGSSVDIGENQLVGMHNRINVVLHTGSEVERDQRRAALMDAWFEDLGAVSGPVLMLFDTFEHAPTEVQGWLSGPFLTRAARTDSIRVVIAGQNVPNSINIEWGHCCHCHDLYGVREARHWMPVLQAMRRRIPFADPETWLAGACHALEGSPDAIMKLIGGLPGEE
jgi:hypothetical protein